MDKNSLKAHRAIAALVLGKVLAQDNKRASALTMGEFKALVQEACCIVDMSELLSLDYDYIIEIMRSSDSLMRLVRWIGDNIHLDNLVFQHGDREMQMLLLEAMRGVWGRSGVLVDRFKYDAYMRLYV